MASVETIAASQPAWTAERRLLAGLALLVALVAVYERRQSDPDTWGHLRYGQFFAEQGLRDCADPFAYTSAGRPWHAHEWLAQWLLWQAYRLGGPLGLILLKCLVGGAAVWFLWRAIRLASGDVRLWAPVLMLTAGMVGRWFLFRPQLFTFCFFAYFAAILFAHLKDRRTPLWTLPLVEAAWANLHGGFLAGLGLIGLVLGLRGLQAVYRNGFRSRSLAAATWPLGLTLIAALAATMLTPFGLDLWRYVLTEMTHDTNRLYIDEWMPLLRFARHAWTIATVFLLLGLLLFTGLLAQLRPVRGLGLPAWVWLFSCLPLTWMAFTSVRHVPLFVLWAGPVLALLAQSAAAGWRESPLWQRGWLTATTLVGLPTFLGLYFSLADPRPRITTGPEPTGAVAFLRDHHLHGNVYAPLEWGSYLTWELYPDVRVAMDGRNVTLFPSTQVQESLLFYLEGTDPEAPLRYETDYLLVPPAAAVLRAVRRDHRWTEVYAGSDAVLFQRADSTRPRAVPSRAEKPKAPPGFEPGMADLQSAALPLG
jgi:hypothetical protein